MCSSGLIWLGHTVQKGGRKHSDTKSRAFPNHNIPIINLGITCLWGELNPENGTWKSLT
jgi:hypothetical protein